MKKKCTLNEKHNITVRENSIDGSAVEKVREWPFKINFSRIRVGAEFIKGSIIR